MLLNNLYMADLIEKNVYTQQVSEYFGGPKLVMSALLVKQYKFVRSL